ncbi:transcriptional regulator [Mycolicibacterium celeriflavum]|uniref:helix-turn-helix transcriptional regulator n=1 Tax=Mycolicibacterium celeriflavum TaxID=1249101 RepID=UPI0007FF7FA0|nr:helix-turn-helix domain-containing protein [Mycolicibacterium celeriflavum]OBG18539.1 transcriptional regulator [Mycolicibacterium celeriflavum]
MTARRDRLPRNRQRERVLQMVRKHGAPVDAAELAAQLQVHVTTVRFHLNALCEAGAIERTRMYRDGVGRPRTGYRAVAERLDYRALAEILAMELGETVETRAQRAQRAGQRWAVRVAASQDEAVAAQDKADESKVDDSLDRGAVLATEIFNRMGFSPELAAESEPMASLSATSEQTVGRERVIRLHACPVRDLAHAHPEVGCRVHLGMLQGLLDHAATTGGGTDAQDQGLTARLDPFVEPELCLARLAHRERPPNYRPALRERR